MNSMNQICEYSEPHNSQKTLISYITAIDQFVKPKNDSDNNFENDTNIVDENPTKKRHLETFQQKRMYKCICGSIYDTKKKLADHKKKSSQCYSYSNVSIYKCICGEFFVTKRGLANHEKKYCPLIFPKIRCTCRKIHCECYPQFINSNFESL